MNVVLVVGNLHLFQLCFAAYDVDLVAELVLVCGGGLDCTHVGAKQLKCIALF